MVDRPTIVATTTEAEIEELAAEMWPCINLPKAEGVALFAAVAHAYRRMVAGGMTPARAVTQISTIALFVSGLSWDEVPGPRAKVRGGRDG